MNPTQLSGEARDQAWQRITKRHPQYSRYQNKTDREIPVISLARAD